MNHTRESKWSRLFHSERGQVTPIMALMLLAMLGLSALTLDGGRAWFTSRELQAATDSAALAGARAILVPGNTPASIVGAGGVGGVVGTYSATTGNLNARPGLHSVTEVGVLKCYSSLEAQGQPCVGAIPYNAVQVTQTTVLPLYFAGLFGHPNISMTSVGTAAARGGSPRPSNVAVIVDTTLSANTIDTDCNSLTEMQCELNGLQVLLQNLSPCGVNQASCNPVGGVAQNSFDRVSLFTFPNVSTSTVALDTSCTTGVAAATPQNGYWNSVANAGGNGFSNFNFVMPVNPNGGTTPAIIPWPTLPNGLAYSFPVAGATSYAPVQSLDSALPLTADMATYQVTGYLSDYRTSNSATALNPQSALTIAAGGVGGCGGLAPPNYDGAIGTYYAGVLYAAQASLVQQQAANPGSENVIILISDGNAYAPQNWNGYPVLPSSGVPNPASASGNYPSWVNECGQAVTAANYATGQGTTVYTVAYGSEPTGCSTDVGPAMSPCDTMANMASAPQEFYSDWKQSGSGSTCIASQPVTSLNAIFAAIAADLSEARLIPNTTQ